MSLRTQPQTLQSNSRRAYEASDINPRQKVAEIIAALKKAPYKFTIAGKARSEIKQLDPEDREEIIILLRTASHLSENADVAKYLKEIFD